MRLKKVDPEWKPSENPSLPVGGIIEITDYVYLVKTQKAVLVDENDNEIPLPGESYQCGVCFARIGGTLVDYTNHVIEKHSPKVKEPEVKEGKKEVSKEELEAFLHPAEEPESESEKEPDAVEKARAALK